MAKITYTDKQSVRSSLESAQNLVTADDLNEIKTSVNTLYDEGANQVKNTFGWALYVDTGNSLVITSTDTLLTIDSASSITTYKPRSFTGEMWANNAIQSEVVGDAYDGRLDFTIASTANNPNYIEIKLDIGGQATPSNIVVKTIINLLKTPPYTYSIAFPYYTMDTFVANGGQIFMATDTGSVTITNRDIFIKRDFTPAIQNGG